jgi:hypothetical protein
MRLRKKNNKRKHVDFEIFFVVTVLEQNLAAVKDNHAR